MLATLNPKQIVDEIVKDTVRDNDPHDAIQISPDVVLASRPIGAAPSLAPDIAPRLDPKIAPEIGPSAESVHREPRFSATSGPQQASTPPVEAAIRISGEDRALPQRSALGKWVRGAFVIILLAGASAGATIAWHKHGDMAKQALAAWTPALASLLPSQTAPVAAAETTPPTAPSDSVSTQAAPDQTATQAAAPAAQAAPAIPAATSSDSSQTVQPMTPDLAAMAQQIEQLKADIAGLKAAQEQMTRELARPPAPKSAAADSRLMDAHARAAASPSKPPAPPARKPKPVVSRTYMPAYSPPPPAPLPPPSQAAAVAPPVVPAPQAVADDDGPIVRPPMPLR